LYDVDVVRVPISPDGAFQATAQIAAEKVAGNTHNGSVGLVWTNGPDFYAERHQNLLYGPFATQLPNSPNFNFSNPGIAFDFGQPTEGFEFPYNGAQIVFIYNPLCPNLENGPPLDMSALVGPLCGWSCF
jgi:putative thiamine transport system substrate-binding protein